MGNANTAITDVNTYNKYRQGLINYAKSKYDEGTLEYDTMINQIDSYLGGLISVTGNELGNLQYISTGIENVIEA